MKCVINTGEDGGKAKGGRPANKPFMKLGKVEITRIDSLNWAVDQGERTTYHTRLPEAVKRAAEAAAEGKAHDAYEWLGSYAKIVEKLDRTLEDALKRYTVEGA